MSSNRSVRYPGAQSFTDDALSRSLFFGREAESDKLLNQIIANRLVVVYARSGLGKTSLLRAGIAEDLRDEGFLPLMARVNDSVLGPFKSVLLDIQREAERQAIEYVPGSADSLWHFFKTVQFWKGDRLMTPVLILDQFEELFTLHDHAPRNSFLDQLGAVIRGVAPASPVRLPLDHVPQSDVPADSPAEPQVRIVFGIREDYLGFLDEGADQIPQILHQRLRLTPLSLDGARQAIEKPAALDDAGLRVRSFGYADGTVTAILEFLAKRSTSSVVGGSPSVDPFQLQLICHLAERRSKSAAHVAITLDDLGGESGLQGVLADFYLTRLKEVPRRKRRAVRLLCERTLISAEGHRLSVDEREIERTTKLDRPALERLVDERLLRSDRRADSVYYELSHDTLVEPILSTRRGMQRMIGWGYAIGGGTAAVFALLFLTVGALFPIMYWNEAEFGPSCGLVMGGSYAVLGLMLLLAGRMALKVGIDRIRRYRSQRSLKKAKLQSR